MEQEILALGQEWVAAEQHGDIDFLSRTLTDDFIGVGPRGFVLTKPQWITRLQSGDLHYTAVTLDEVQVRTYGDAAITTGHVTNRGAYKGNDIAADLRATLVFVRQDRRWLLATVHFSPIG